MTNIIVHDDGPVRIIRMNRPEKKNALTQDMYAEIIDTLDRSSADDAVRCVVITGTGGAFTAGNDLANFRDRSADQENASPGGGALLLRALLRNTKPLIAAVDGVAFGIGMTLMFHCDYVVATEAAKFATPFVSLGLVPEGGSTLLMPLAIGHQKAFEMLVLGRRMDGKAVFDAGVVNKLAEAGCAEADAVAIAHEIAALPAKSVALTREMLRLPVEQLAARIDLELEHFNAQMRSPEAAAAFARFLAPKN